MEFDQITEEEGLKLYSPFKNIKTNLDQYEKNFRYIQPNQIDILKKYIKEIKETIMKLYNKEITKEETDKLIENYSNDFVKNYKNTLVGYPYVIEQNENVPLRSFTFTLTPVNYFENYGMDTNGNSCLIDTNLYNLIEIIKVLEMTIIKEPKEEHIKITIEYIPKFKELIIKAVNKKLTIYTFQNKMKNLMEQYNNKLLNKNNCIIS